MPVDNEHFTNTVSPHVLRPNRCTGFKTNREGGVVPILRKDKNDQPALPPPRDVTRARRAQPPGLPTYASRPSPKFTGREPARDRRSEGRGGGRREETRSRRIVRPATTGKTSRSFQLGNFCTRPRSRRRVFTLCAAGRVPHTHAPVNTSRRR